MNKATTWVGLGLGLGITLGACYRYDPTYCGNLDGHETCRYLGLGQYCSLCDFDKDGCVESRPSDDCLAPFEIPVETEGSSSDGGSETGGTETASTGGGPGSGSVGSGSSGDMPCVGPEDCSAETPICGAQGECVRCDAVADPDGACAELDWRAPLCVGGRCVSCTAEDTSTCDGQLLLCDPVTNACMGCTEHEQCEAGACRLDEGFCFPPDLVAHVDADGGQEFLGINEAIGSFSDGSFGVIVVYERAAQTPYTEAVVVDGGKILAIVAAPGEAPAVLGTGSSVGIAVQDAGSTLYLEGFLITSGDDFGLTCNDARVDIRRSHIIQNLGGGVLAQAGCTLSVENSFIGGTVDNDALDVQGSTASVLYSTLAASAMIATSPAALRCDAPSAVEVRNAILVGASSEPELQCSAATVTTSATESNLGGSNTTVGNLDIAWFEDFISGDFSLTTAGGTTFEMTAVWEDGDPPTDINGAPRPGVAGSLDYAGADLP